jgi:hypothetical protein
MEHRGSQPPSTKEHMGSPATTDHGATREAAVEHGAVGEAVVTAAVTLSIQSCGETLEDEHSSHGHKESCGFWRR